MIEQYTAFRASAEGHMLLALLNIHPKVYGRELHRKCDGAVKIGSMYGLLSKLEHAGFVRGEEYKEEYAAGRPKVIWSLTEEGEEILSFLNQIRDIQNRVLSKRAKEQAKLKKISSKPELLTA